MKTATPFIQRIELCEGLAVRCPPVIHCPLCGGCVFDATGPHVQPCDHTLFVATDLGFEYRSELFNGVMGLSAGDTPELYGEDNFDRYTDRVRVPNSVKFALFSRVLDNVGVYVGFAPFVR